MRFRLGGRQPFRLTPSAWGVGEQKPNLTVRIFGNWLEQLATATTPNCLWFCVKLLYQGLYFSTSDQPTGSPYVKNPRRFANAGH